MDTAVALVKSYLQANGFFTISEYPILESLSGHEPRTVTDVDVIGVRFPGAGDSATDATLTGLRTPPHDALGVDDDRIEVVIGEVKEGAAVLNRAATDRGVLLAVLRRLGRMEPGAADEIVTELAESGESLHPAGIRVRLLVFASKPPTRDDPRFTWISLGSITTWLTDVLRENWDRVKTIQSKDPAVGFMILIEKAMRGES